MTTLQSINEMTEANENHPLPSIQCAKIVNVGPVKPTADGLSKFQILTVSRDDEELKIFLYCQSLFLDQGLDKNYVSFMAGPPVKGKPVGIIFRVVNSKKRVEVRKGARMMLHSEMTDKVTHEEPKEEVKEEVQLTETTESESTEEVAGPHDEYVRTQFAIKAHIHRIVVQENNLLDPMYRYRDEDLSAIGTGILMGSFHDGIKGFLPKKKVYQSTTKKFDPIEKPHNPVAAAVKSTQGEASELPVNEDDPIASWIRENKDKSWFSVKNSKGVPVGESFQIPESRRKAMHWFYRQRAEGKTGNDKTAATFTAIDKLYMEDAPSSLQLAIAAEVVHYDVLLLTKKENDPMAWDQDNVAHNINCLFNHYGEGLKAGNIKGMALKYFKDTEDNRMLHIQIPF